MKKYNVTVNGETFSVDVVEVGGAAAPAAPVVASAPAAAPAAAPAPSASGNSINSPLPGTVIRVNVSVGQAVKAGDVLMVLEAMKMENDITAPGDGVVSALHVAANATVQSGDPLVSL